MKRRKFLGAVAALGLAPIASAKTVVFPPIEGLLTVSPLSRTYTKVSVDANGRVTSYRMTDFALING